MAPKESQDAIKEFGRPEYEQWLKEFPHTQSLEAKAQVEAFRHLGPAGRRAEDEVSAMPADRSATASPRADRAVTRRLPRSHRDD